MCETECEYYKQVVYILPTTADGGVLTVGVIITLDTVHHLWFL
jgi:hypothetical protein